MAVAIDTCAGLRSIPGDKAEEIVDVSRAILAESGFLFHPDWARVITGSEEGLRGWIAVNYLRGALQNEKMETHGVVEMGGARCKSLSSRMTRSWWPQVRFQVYMCDTSFFVDV